MKKGLEKFNNLVDALMELPSIGKKSATRLAYHMVLNDPFSALKLSHAIEDAISYIKKCKICGGICEDEVCEICLDERRDDERLCIVESAKDILVLEEGSVFDGKYFVLENTEQNSIESSIDRLKDIVKQRDIKEIIFALTPSLANDSIIYFVEDRLKDFDINFTKIAQGVPTGVTLENIDLLSLTKAINDRVKV